eukprot:3684127-Prymnesium_polylepis.2
MSVERAALVVLNSRHHLTARFERRIDRHEDGIQVPARAVLTLVIHQLEVVHKCREAILQTKRKAAALQTLMALSTAGGASHLVDTICGRAAGTGLYCGIERKRNNLCRSRSASCEAEGTP